MAVDQGQIPGASFEQYDLAARMSPLEFFRHVRRTHQTRAESPQMFISRHYDESCRLTMDRVDIVQRAVDFVRSVGGRCLNFEEYDAHSTPSRDSGLMTSFQALAAAYNEVAGREKWDKSATTWLKTRRAFSKQCLQIEKAKYLRFLPSGGLSKPGAEH